MASDTKHVLWCRFPGIRGEVAEDYAVQEYWHPVTDNVVVSSHIGRTYIADARVG
jgi:hypothetical protein